MFCPSACLVQTCGSIPSAKYIPAESPGALANAPRHECESPGTQTIEPEALIRRLAASAVATSPPSISSCFARWVRLGVGILGLREGGNRLQDTSSPSQAGIRRWGPFTFTAINSDWY